MQIKYKPSDLYTVQINLCKSNRQKARYSCPGKREKQRGQQQPATLSLRMGICHTPSLGAKHCWISWLLCKPVVVLCQGTWRLAGWESDSSLICLCNTYHLGLELAGSVQQNLGWMSWGKKKKDCAAFWRQQGWPHLTPRCKFHSKSRWAQ